MLCQFKLYYPEDFATRTKNKADCKANNSLISMAMQF